MKLTNCKKEDLFRGTKFEFSCEYNSTYTKKRHVLMLCEYPVNDEDIAPFALYYVEGYYAGTMFTTLPKEALTKTPYTMAISRTWLEKNWKEWVDYRCSPKKVKIKL